MKRKKYEDMDVQNEAMKTHLFDENDEYYEVEINDIFKQFNKKEQQEIVALREQARELYYNETDHLADEYTQQEKVRQFDLEKY